MRYHSEHSELVSESESKSALVPVGYSVVRTHLRIPRVPYWTHATCAHRFLSGARTAVCDMKTWYRVCKQIDSLTLTVLEVLYLRSPSFPFYECDLSHSLPPSRSLSL